MNLDCPRPVKDHIKVFLWRYLPFNKFKCRICVYLKLPGNGSPCYACYKFDNYIRTEEEEWKKEMKQSVLLLL